MIQPTPKHKEEAREMEHDELIEPPLQVWLHVYADADCWCCYHFDKDDDPRHLTEYIRVDTLSSRDTQIREVLEGLITYVDFDNGGNPVQHWCAVSDDGDSECNDACLAARGLWERVQVGVKKGESNVVE